MQRFLAPIPALAEHRGVALHWDDLRFLLALRRAGSLGAAARLLKVETSTVSRRLAALESALGAQLATRTPEGLVLNKAGLRASELAETMDKAVEEIVAQLACEDQRAEGAVRLAATEATATFLMRGLVSLRELHPKIQVELVVGSAAVDLTRNEADIAVRGRETNPTLVARKVAEIGWSLYASAAYVERAGIACGPNVAVDDLAIDDFAVIGYREPVNRSPGAVWLSTNTRPQQIVLAGDSVASVVNAVRSGMGVSALPCFVAMDQPDLVRLTSTVVAKGDLYVIIPPNHRETRRVRVVMEAIVELCAREPALLAGVAGVG